MNYLPQTLAFIKMCEYFTEQLSWPIINPPGLRVF